MWENAGFHLIRFLLPSRENLQIQRSLSCQGQDVLIAVTLFSKQIVLDNPSLATISRIGNYCQYLKFLKQAESPCPADRFFLKDIMFSLHKGELIYDIFQQRSVWPSSWLNVNLFVYCSHKNTFVIELAFKVPFLIEVFVLEISTCSSAALQHRSRPVCH